MKKLALFLLILCCVAVLMGQKSVYTWTDERGTVHVSDEKPSKESNVQELKYGPRPNTPEPEQDLEGDNSTNPPAAEQEEAEKTADYEKSKKQEETAKRQEQYDKLQAEEKSFLDLRENAKNPFAYNYSQQKIREIEQQKQELLKDLQNLNESK